MGAPLEV